MTVPNQKLDLIRSRAISIEEKADRMTRCWNKTKSEILGLALNDMDAALDEIKSTIRRIRQEL